MGILMTFFKRLSFKTRLLLTVALSCLICALVSVAVSLHFSQQELHKGIIAKGETVLSRLDAATDYVANQGGLAPTIDRITKKYESYEEITKEDKLEVLKQVPIFAAMKIGAQDSVNEHYTFRVFSDEPRNRENLATPEELAILKQFEADPKLTQKVITEDNIISVYRPVRLDESQGCLLCHGNPENSPWRNGRDVLGFKMENWKDGKLHGVFAVKTDIATVLAAQSSKESISPTALLAILIGLGAAAALLLAAFFVKGPLQKVSEVVAALSEASVQVNTAASQISKASGDLSDATSLQSSSIEQTASAVQQLTSMVDKNSNNAEGAAMMSKQSSEAAGVGREVVSKMMDSMDQINDSNNRIMVQIDQSNQEISEIVKVIQEISTKTRVINDIVFQTKLLSFNASVEAARAGQHGKGFAVVAEEIGNLASMSGSAANEISALLEQSIKRVDAIVQDTKSKVEILVHEGKTVVESGAVTARDCGEVLHQIVENVSQVSQMANEISFACREQAQGVSEISKAMIVLDEGTHKNESASQETARIAQGLAEQAASLQSAVAALESTLSGHGNEEAMSA